MPWCTTCDRFLSPNTVLGDGTCPTCHGTISRPPATGAVTTDALAAEPLAGEVAPEDDEHTPIPWHLWLLIAAVVVYLGYRAFQGLELLFG